jgi:hypothetical protein
MSLQLFQYKPKYIRKLHRRMVGKGEKLTSRLGSKAMDLAVGTN